MAPGRGPKGPLPKVQNPGKLLARLLRYIGKKYGVSAVWKPHILYGWMVRSYTLYPSRCRTRQYSICPTSSI